MHNLKFPPNIEILDIDDLKPSDFEYLKVIGRWVKFKYSDGTISEPFWSQHIYRHGGINAAIIIAYYMSGDITYVYLRSCLRPAVQAYNPNDGNLWELAAGKIENESPVQCAIREAEEELGFKIKESNMIPLGKPVYASVGLMGEKLYFFSCEVNPKLRENPSEDGSPMEKNGVIISVSLDEALKACDNGILKDSKTEIGLNRFYRKLYGA